MCYFFPELWYYENLISYKYEIHLAGKEEINEEEEKSHFFSQN